jgi:hypothetical protein
MQFHAEPRACTACWPHTARDGTSSMQQRKHGMISPLMISASVFSQTYSCQTAPHCGHVKCVQDSRPFKRSIHCSDGIQVDRHINASHTVLPQQTLIDDCPHWRHAVSAPSSDDASLRQRLLPGSPDPVPKPNRVLWKSELDSSARKWTTAVAVCCHCSGAMPCRALQ